MMDIALAAAPPPVPQQPPVRFAMPPSGPAPASSPSLAPHRLPRRAPCTYGCGALVWEEERDRCCKKGTMKLSEEHNPPICPHYMALLQQPGVSHNARQLNRQLAFGATGTSPSREVGGLGFHYEPRGVSFVKLQGKVYHTFNNPLDPTRGSFSGLGTYALPNEFVQANATSIDVCPYRTCIYVHSYNNPTIPPKKARRRRRCCCGGGGVNHGC